MAEKRRYGYIRVSTKRQNESRQKAAILREGVQERDIFIDKKSGKDFSDRPQFDTMMNLLQPGDEVVILELDRLGRNYDEMAVVWREITRDKECDITVINCPILNTAQEEKETLNKRFISTLTFEILSYVAEKEREEIKERQREGIISAQAQGKRFGRPPIEKPKNFSEVYQKVKNWEITNVEAQRRLSLKPSTYYRFVNEEKNNKEL